MFAKTEFDSTLAILIPIIAIVMGIGVAFVAIITDYKRKRHIFELHHKERLAAIERGVEVPPLPEGLFDHHKSACRPRDYFRKGIVGVLLGMALWPVLREVAGYRWQWIGLVPAAVGRTHCPATDRSRLPGPARASSQSGSRSRGVHR